MEEKYEFVETIDYGKDTHIYKVREYETNKVSIHTTILYVSNFTPLVTVQSVLL